MQIAGLGVEDPVFVRSAEDIHRNHLACAAQTNFLLAVVAGKANATQTRFKHVVDTDHQFPNFTPLSVVEPGKLLRLGVAQVSVHRLKLGSALQDGPREFISLLDLGSFGEAKAFRGDLALAKPPQERTGCTRAVKELERYHPPMNLAGEQLVPWN